MSNWHGWNPGFVGALWLDGRLTTAELDECLTDPESLRAQRDDYVLELVDRYDPEAR